MTEEQQEEELKYEKRAIKLRNVVYHLEYYIQSATVVGFFSKNGKK